MGQRKVTRVYLVEIIEISTINNLLNLHSSNRQACRGLNVISNYFCENCNYEEEPEILPREIEKSPSTW